MHLKQGAIEIPAGGTYGFGSRTIGAESDAAFSIHNSGGSDLSLTGIPLVLGGTDLDQFSIVTQPASTVLPAGSNMLVVRFRPTTPGIKTAWVSIENDAPGGSPFVLNLTGTGVIGPTQGPRIRRRLSTTP